RGAVGADRHGAAAGVPVHGHRRVEPAVRQPRRDRRRAVGRARARAGRGLRARDARAAGGAACPGRHQRLGRPAPAARDRARAAAQTGRVPVRRLVLGARSRDRSEATPGHRTTARQGDRDPHRAAGREHPPCASDPGARRRQARRQGHPRAARRDVPAVCGDRRIADRAGRGGGMSTNRPAPAAQRPAGFAMRGPMGGMMGPPQKAKNFKGAARRLLGLLAPHRGLVIAVLACCTVAVAFTVSGPKMLGRATDIIFKGFLGTHPAGANPGALARVMHVQVGRGIDFGELVQVLALVMALYAGAVVFMWLQGYILTHLVQRVVNRLRADVDAKLMRVPLEYFDRQPRGEVLSRVTNDIENVAMGLQQTMSQIMTATLTVLGVLVMLVVISPLLAVVALVTVPLSIVITAKIGQRAQKGFAAQWKHVGALNGQIEEAFTGHALVKVFGRRRQVEERFRAKNDELYEAGFRAQFVSSLIMPAITFVGNLNYVAIAVVGGLRVASGAMLLGSVQAFIQYSRQFTQNLSQLAQVANVLQSGVASAERVFELLDEPEQSRDR